MDSRMGHIHHLIHGTYWIYTIHTYSLHTRAYVQARACTHKNTLSNVQWFRVSFGGLLLRQGREGCEKKKQTVGAVVLHVLHTDLQN